MRSRRSLLLLAIVAAACKKDSPGPDAGVTTLNLSAAASFGLVGDSVLFTARVIDGNGQTVQGAAVTWTSSNTAVATVSAAGYVTGRAVGTTTITSRAGVAVAALSFEVDPSPCGSSLTFAPGEVRRLRGATAFGCAVVPAATSSQDYLFIVGNAQMKQDDTLSYSFSLSGTGASAMPSTDAYGLTDPRDIALVQGVSYRDGVEQRLRSFERKVTTDALEYMQGRPAAPRDAALRAVTAAAVAGVGDTVAIRVPNLNPGKGICKDFIPIRAVVRAVSARATLMEDITAPTGRLTATDYSDIGQEFDAKIYATDTLWFGAPTDINTDQRISIVYTPEVNKLTPAGGTGIVGGFFFGGDLLKRSDYPTTNDCRNQTNEQEIFYLLAADPTGSINGNARTTAGVRQVSRGTIAHEFQHMINQGVRQYNPAVKAFETPWLNEALSHFAEEAVGRAVSGFSDFQSLRTLDVNPSAVNQNDYLAFYRQNLTRFRLWMLRPDTASPTSDRARDQLASRGAAWAFVRYAADRYSGGNARAFFRKLAAGPETDITNLVLRTGAPFDEVVGGWLVANFAENRNIPGLDPKFTYPSWDMADVMKGVNSNVYPLAVTSFPGSFTSQALAGSGNYYLHRLAGGAGPVNLNLRTPGGSTMAAPGARLWVVRLN
jgi:hypothetical protein